MPFKSEAQRRAMYAAAAGKSTIGIPEEVGEKFVRHKDDESGSVVHAAGIMLESADGKLLLVKRSSKNDDHAGEWAFPGGKIEEGETPLQAAIRECVEEVGYKDQYVTPHHPVATLLLGNVEFHAFHQQIGEEFNAIINEESDGIGWFHPHNLPTPMHVGALSFIEHKFGKPESNDVNELDIMKAVRDGRLPSPQQFGNLHIFDLRISGTGFATRHDTEIACRSPQDYLSDEFLERCQGLPVIWEHPEEKLLDTESYRQQSIGTIVLPYVKGDEVWGIARIYDAEAAELMAIEQLSTSPAVTLGDNSFKTGNVLIEGSPQYLDHVAVCRVGVWDKGGAPMGVRSDIVKPDSLEVHMDDKTEVSMADILAAINGINAKVDGISTRMDSIEAKADAKHDLPHNKIADDDDDKADKKDDDDDDKADKLEEVAGVKHCKEDAKKEDDCADSKADAARADAVKIADLERRLQAFEDQNKVSDEDRAEMVSAQSKADSLAMALGDTASRHPVAGETAFAFRKRMAANFSKYSNKFKGVNINAIGDKELFAPIEDAIYADASAYAKAPPAMPGMLREVKERMNGREISNFVGDPSAWMDPFANGVRYKGGFRNTQH